MKLTHYVLLRAAKGSATGIIAVALLVAACSGNSTPTHGASVVPTIAAPSGTPVAPSLPSASTLPTSAQPTATSAMPTDTAAPGATTAPSDTPAPTDSGSPAPEQSGSTTGGDIPDNAVFLTYKDATHAFSIDYVEGWQVTTSTDGVQVRDKDSSETVTIVPPVTDVAAYVSGTDLPALQAVSPFRLETQDMVKIHGKDVIHLLYHTSSPPDPVTGKQVPSTLDRYYIPGTNGLAIVTLSTPNGVDNVDAFRQMVESFKWQ